MRLLLLLLCASSSSLAQKPARIGPDGKPLLNRPELGECQKSKRATTYSTVKKICDILTKLVKFTVYSNISR